MFKSRAFATTALTHISLAITLVCGWSVNAHANPEDGVVTSGSADIVANGPKLDIHQHSDRAVIDWRSFNIGIDEHTQFYQPSSSSVVLNRVNSADPSYILGKLTANGNVILINPNGVFFGAGSRVDVNGLIASTADITDHNFMNGQMTFDKAGKENGFVINEGHITAGEAGLVGLVAPNVMNTGIIEAKLGRVHLAGGDTATIDLYGDGLMEVAVEGAGHSQSVVNTGIIDAEGGTIAMTAAAGKDIVDNLIVVKGELKAPAIGTKNGKISIFAEGSNAVVKNDSTTKGKKSGGSAVIVQAKLDASGRKEGEKGGSIEVLGDDIAILNGTIMDASGHSGKTNTTDGKLISDAREDSAGGSIRIGGDYLGQGETATAKNLFIDTYTLFYNDALHEGDAGRTIFWSDNDTIFKGNVYARGGVIGGNGGFVETSGHNNLVAQGYVDLTAANGSKGTYFLDPSNITIYGDFAPNYVSTDSSIDLGASIRTWLDASQLTGYNNGDFISSWADMSGKGADATTPVGTDLAPTYQINVLNGLPVIRFDGTDDKLISTFDQTFSNSSATVFMLSRQTGGHSLATAFGLKPTDSTMTYYGWWVAKTLNYYGLTGTVRSNVGHTDLWSGKQWQQLMAMADGTNANVWRNGSATPYSVNAATGSKMIDALVLGGQRATAHNEYAFGGDIAEVVVYGDTISADERLLMNQYQYAKWGQDTGVSSLSAATDPNTGYGAFTTRYLERLANTADIVLQASNGITLDLQGDTLDFTGGSAAGKSLTLQTTNGNITDVSAGTIRTTKTGSSAGQYGNINLVAGGAGNITLDTTNLEALNGGLVSLSAGGTINLQQTSAVNLDTAIANSVTVQATNGITGSGKILARSGTIALSSTNDVDLRNAAIKTTNQAITVSGRDVLLSTALQSGTGQVSVTGSRDISLHAPTDNSNLTAFWNFNEGTGTNVEDTAGIYDGAVIGPAWSSNTFDGTGYSLMLDGVDDYINLPSTGTYNVAGNMGLAYNADWSVSVWYKGTDTAQNGDWGKGLIGWDSTNLWAGLSLRNGYAEYSHYGTGWEHDIKSSTMVADGNWHQITLINHANATADLYIDGVREVSGVGSAYSNPGIYFQPKQIGANYNHAYTSGQIDNVRIYSSALSSTQALQLDASWQSGSVLLNAGRDITLNAAVTASGSGDAIIASAGRNFINNAGVNALKTTNINGRSLVYSTNPGQNTFGGLTYGTDYTFRRFGCTYSGGCGAGVSIPGTGNGFLYSYVPTLTVTPDAIADVTYGDAVPNLTNYTYTITGWLHANDISAITGTLNGATTYVDGSNAGTTHTISHSGGSLSNSMGYSFTYAANNAAFGVNKASLQIAAEDVTMLQGANPTINYLYTGFVNGQNFVSSGITGTPSLSMSPTSRGPGTYDMDLDMTGLSSVNYQFGEAAPKGRLIVNAPPSNNVIPPSVAQTIANPVNTPSAPTQSAQGNKDGEKDKTIPAPATEKTDPVVSAMVADGLLEIDPAVQKQFNLCVGSRDGSCGIGD